MLKQDIFKRVTTNRLPEAHGAFLDEIFKASSAILNTLLRILNERQFENGDGTFLQCPLLIVVAASNEWPDEQNGGKELGALFDRFLFRKTVRPIASLGGRNRLLWNDLQIKLSTEVTPQEIVQASKEVEQVGWTESAQDTFGQILSTLNMEGVFPGDRRIRKSVKACQAYAYLNGADEVERDHLEILRHTLWDDPKEQPEVTSKVVVKLANPVNAILTDKMLQAQEIAQKSAPAEVAAKLSEILKEVELLQDTPKKEMVLKYIKAERKASYNKIMGIA
jgi:MoxR-like ATPase